MSDLGRKNVEIRAKRVQRKRKDNRFVWWFKRHLVSVTDGERKREKKKDTWA